MLYGYRQFRCIHKNDIYDDVYKDIAEDVDTRFDTSNYELDRPFPNGKIKKVIGLMKDKLGGKIMTKFAGLRAKTYSYLVDDSSEDKKPKTQKNFVIKRKLKYENYKDCLETTQLQNKINHLEKNKTDIDSVFCYKRKHKKSISNNKLILKTQQRFKSEKHNVFTGEINKIALSSNDNKKVQSIDSIETFAYGTRKDLVRGHP